MSFRHQLVLDLGVPGRPEHASDPLQLVSKRLGPLAVQQRAERRQRASEPPRRHAHLVHRVRSVMADQGVLVLELGDLLA